jgi:hypothetical protein
LQVDMGLLVYFMKNPLQGSMALASITTGRW